MNSNDEYMKKIVLLDPSNSNKELYYLKSKFTAKKITAEMENAKMLKTLEDRKNQVNSIGNNISYIKKVTLTETVDPIAALKRRRKKNAKNDLVNMDKIMSELKQKNSRYLNDLENMNKEKKYEERMKELRENNLSLNTEANKMYSLLKTMESETIEKMTEITLNKNCLNQLEIEYNKRMNRKVFDELKSSVIVIHKEEENEHLKKVRQVYNENVTELEENNRVLELEIKQKREEIVKIRNILKETRNKVESNIKEIKEIKNKLIVHYHEILLEGNDSRSEGLSWVIMAIWNLDEEVIIDYFPEFLDEVSINYLFSVTRKQFELESLKQKIIDSREKIKSVRNRNAVDFGNETFKTEIGNRNTNELLYDRRVHSLEKYKHGNVKTIHEIVKHIIYPHMLDDYTQSLLDNVRLLEQKKESILKDLKEERQREVERLHKEFLFNNYASRFSTCIETVFKCLLGTNIDAQLNKLSSDELKMEADSKKIKMS